MKAKGFTIIELIIVLMITAIFGAIAHGMTKEKAKNTERVVQAERFEPSTDFAVKCYNGVLYFTTTNANTGIEYPTTPVILNTPDRLRPTLC